MEKKFFIFLTFFMLTSLNLYAQKPISATNGLDFDNQDPAMNEKYNKGRHLVYDCDGYYVCTKEEEYTYCKERREKAISELDISLYCAPIKAFASEKKCQKRQLELTSMGRAVTFCTHPKEKFLR